MATSPHHIGLRNQAQIISLNLLSHLSDYIDQEVRTSPERGGTGRDNFTSIIMIIIMMIIIMYLPIAYKYHQQG